MLAVFSLKGKRSIGETKLFRLSVILELAHITRHCLVNLRVPERKELRGQELTIKECVGGVVFIRAPAKK